MPRRGKQRWISWVIQQKKGEKKKEDETRYPINAEMSRPSFGQLAKESLTSQTPRVEAPDGSCFFDGPLLQRANDSCCIVLLILVHKLCLSIVDYIQIASKYWLPNKRGQNRPFTPHRMSAVPWVRLSATVHLHHASQPKHLPITASGPAPPTKPSPLRATPSRTVPVPPLKLSRFGRCLLLVSRWKAWVSRCRLYQVI